MDLQYLMEVLVTCPNLKEFHIAIRKTGTNVQAAPRPSAVDFKMGGKLPPLEEVVLERYFLRLNGFCDVSQLRRVILRDIIMIDFLRSVRGRDLPRLEVFRLEERCSSRAGGRWAVKGVQIKMEIFLSELPSLHVLSLPGVVDRIPNVIAVIATHGQTLRSLQLLEARDWMQTDNTTCDASSAGGTASCCMLSPQDINLLNVGCLYLEKLTLDIVREADWVWIVYIYREHVR